MSDLENKIMKGSELGESFSDLMKRVVEKELEEGNADAPDQFKDISDLSELKDIPESEFLIKSEDAVEVKPASVPVFEWNKEKPAVVEDYQPVSEVGVISSSTTINGTVSSKGHIRIEGGVIGDVFAYGDIKITGKVAGDIDGSNIELGGCVVDGDIKARGDVAIGKDSSLSGNMSGQIITIDGKIKGNIDAAKGAHMSGTSVVKGSITAPTLSMSAGAELIGKVEVAKDDVLD